MNHQEPVQPERMETSGRAGLFAPRMAKTPRSFIREILKVTEDPGITSFAGGLPNPDLIDVEGIAAATARVLAQDGRTVLQYSTTEGYLPLRQWICDRYRKRLGLSVSPDEVLITNGSQQCLDLIGKVFIGTGDNVAIERPGYLGAIQAFSLYEPVFRPVLLHEDGPDTAMLANVLEKHRPKFFYGVPNSQNPSGITYSEERRKEVAALLSRYGVFMVEDDAYGELNFSGISKPSFRSFMPELTIITGSFSKILAPGMRLGWIVAPPEVMEQVVTAKQASDLHSNYLSQRIAMEYLCHTDIDAHIRKVQAFYHEQCRIMLEEIGKHFPHDVQCTSPQGGMFVWVTLPDGVSSMDVFEAAIKENVAVLPGIPFYIDGGGDNTLRINFSNASHERIRSGIAGLARVIRNLDNS